MTKLILMIRDKSWFYTKQLYPNNTDESNFTDFKIRFSLFFLPPVILIIGITGWFFSVFLNKPVDISIYSYHIVIPLVIIFGSIYYYIYSFIFKKIEKFPINETNNSGYLKNGIFVVGLISSEVLIAFLLIFLIFKIRV